jgi:hypothetical protein
MQLDKTLIAIRERGFLDILDLALRVWRARLAAIWFVAAVGILPFAIANHLLLEGMVWGFDLLSADQPPDELVLGWMLYLYIVMLLVLIEIPLATAPLTLYLGQMAFSQRVDGKRVALETLKSLPQLALLQGVGRTMLAPWGITCFLPMVLWPYLNEVILLERNPLLRRKSSDQPTTLQRLSKLHAPNAGDVILRGLGSMTLGPLLVAALWISTWMIHSLLVEDWRLTMASATIYFQGAIWSVAVLFTIVRFLSYLDLRIRNEGWELELRMRAESLRLAVQTA